MQLLFQRQKGLNQFGRPTFKLWVKFDLTSEEMELISKYSVQKFLLWRGDFLRDFWRALIYAIPCTLIAFLFIIFVERLAAAFLITPFVFCLIVYIIYEQIREQIKIIDVLEGRYFSCRSVVSLAAREQKINNMAIIFCKFLEAMKTWGGKEIIECPFGKSGRR